MIRGKKCKLCKNYINNYRQKEKKVKQKNIKIFKAYFFFCDNKKCEFYTNSRIVSYIILQIRQATTVDKRVDIRTITMGRASFLTLSPAK